MTGRKPMIIAACIYAVCGVIWSAMCVVNWRMEGAFTASAMLYGASAACWVTAAALNVIRICRMGGKTKEE